MASKKTKGSTALAKTGGMAIQPWMTDLASEAKGDAAKFQTGVARISFQSGRIQIDKQPIRDDHIDVVIVEAIFGKAYYLKGFKAGEAQTPVCYAFHENEPAEMIPHEACPDKQAEKCATCPHNRFGTAIGQDGEAGAGKRCKDEIRLMCGLGADSEDAESIVKAEFRMASVPPGSLKHWGKYIAKLRDLGLTFRAVVTRITISPEGGAYKLTFDAVKTINEQQYKALSSKREGARSEMMQPYPALEDSTPKAPAKRRAVKGQ